MKLSVFPNLGNTCYLNSVLQCFIHHQEFQDIIKDYDLPFVTELKKMTIDLSENKEYTAVLFRTTNLLEQLPFKRFEQQDAHECILAFLELLIKECPYKQTNLNSVSGPFIPIYHGKTKTSICCLNCKTIKYIFEEYNSINLNIPLENSNLIDLFKCYLEKEIHTDMDNLYYCETCKCKQVYEKKINLQTLPKILIIVLKRYTFTGNKINSEVTFQDNLKIKETESGIVKDYHLTNIINHTGNLYNGHYTNYTILNGKCFFIDDEKIKVEPYNYNDAYILFYKTS